MGVWIAPTKFVYLSPRFYTHSGGGGSICIYCQSLLISIAFPKLQVAAKQAGLGLVGLQLNDSGVIGDVAVQVVVSIGDVISQGPGITNLPLASAGIIANTSMEFLTFTIAD